MTRINVNSWIGRAAMACLLLVPGMACAATPCTSLASNFYSYPAPATGMLVASSAFYLTAAPAGCLWTLTHSAGVTMPRTSGYGSGWVYFGLAANPNRAARSEVIHSLSAASVAGCDPNGNIGGRSSAGLCQTYAAAPILTVTLIEAGK